MLPDFVSSKVIEIGTELGFSKYLLDEPMKYSGSINQDS
jgi:hypothetical protein